MAKRATRRRNRRTPARITAVRNHAQLQMLVEIVNERGEILAQIRRDLDVQFRRLAQIQGELDLIKRAWVKMRNRA